MGFSIDVSIPAIAVFLQGLLSFFSPCVLPLIPLYIGYLSGGTGSVGEDGRMHYSRRRVMVNTLFFVIGISFAFFLLGFGVSAVGSFFDGNQALFTRIGGILIIFFGLYQIGFLGWSRVMGREYRLPFRLDKLAVNPFTALVFGFTFSFAWTPCVGPALASVLLMAASADSGLRGFLLIGVYTLGFVLPFGIVGLFTTTLLELFKKYQRVVTVTVKAGGVLLILMGFMMVTGWMNNISGYLTSITPSGMEQPSGNASPETKEAAGEEEQPEGDASVNSESTAESGTGGNADAASESGEADPQNGEASAESREKDTQNGKASSESGEADRQKVAAPDFTFNDQFGTSHTLSEYKGKTVFLNFWATWCPPCKAEMPDIQKIYEAYGGNEEDLVVLGVAGPDQGREGSEEDIEAFLEDNGYTYPVVMDTTGETFAAYGIASFPTTFMIDTEGNVYGYITGQLSEEIMESIIRQTMEEE